MLCHYYSLWNCHSHTHFSLFRSRNSSPESIDGSLGQFCFFGLTLNLARFLMGPKCPLCDKRRKRERRRSWRNSSVRICFENFQCILGEATRTSRSINKWVLSPIVDLVTWSYSPVYLLTSQLHITAIDARSSSKCEPLRRGKRRFWFWAPSLDTWIFKQIRVLISGKMFSQASSRLILLPHDFDKNAFLAWTQTASLSAKWPLDPRPRWSSSTLSCTCVNLGKGIAKKPQYSKSSSFFI